MFSKTARLPQFSERRCRRYMASMSLMASLYLVLHFVPSGVVREPRSFSKA